MFKKLILYTFFYCLVLSWWTGKSHTLFVIRGEIRLASCLEDVKTTMFLIKNQETSRSQRLSTHQGTHLPSRSLSHSRCFQSFTCHITSSWQHIRIFQEANRDVARSIHESSLQANHVVWYLLRANQVCVHLSQGVQVNFDNFPIVGEESVQLGLNIGELGEHCRHVALGFQGLCGKETKNHGKENMLKNLQLHNGFVVLLKELLLPGIVNWYTVSVWTKMQRIMLQRNRKCVKKLSIPMPACHLTIDI